MKIVADENIPRLQEYFAAFGEVVPVNGRHLQPDQLKDADVLLVRSVTRVNRQLLEGSPVRFVGTCTIGTDHLDNEFLQQANIAYASAPGCNAGGVVQYVMGALARVRPDWLEARVGIVGCGNVGGRLNRTLRKLGVDCRGYDPFLKPTQELDLVDDLDQLMDCDILCLHTPLTRSGPHPTAHLFDADRLAQLKPGCLLLNAGRGEVIDNAALLARLESGADLRVVLDVWENEPAINAELARAVAIGTPHIAGYSNEGRLQGTLMICRALAAYLEWDEADIARHMQQVETRIGAGRGLISVASLAEALAASYDIMGDHWRLQAAIKSNEPLGSSFDNLRKHYPGRHEPAYFDVTPTDASPELAAELKAAGFKLMPAANGSR